MPVDFLSAFGLERGVVAIVGAGGKTTLLFRLAAEAHAQKRRVLVTTTTHMGAPHGRDTGIVLFAGPNDPSERVREALDAEGRVTLLGEQVRNDKVGGITPERVDALAALADVVLVEADGARRKSFKLPADHEPVIPSSTTLVIVAAGLDVLGQPLDEEHVHRLDRVAAAAEQDVGTPVTEDTLVRALGHPDGYLSRVPKGARAAVFLNKAESPAALAAADRVARRLCPPYERVVAGAAKVGAEIVVR